ncbi:MAG: serine/threonine protein kinase [Pseudomonadota bacterium]
MPEKTVVDPSGSFFSLTPDRVLDAVERAGQPTTGLCYALNSLENRVYEVELEDRQRLVAKFYRPGRWSRATILDEHSVLTALDQAEVPTCAPLMLPTGSTLEQTPDSIHFALFPRVGGRAVDELNSDDYRRMGRLLARIHNVAASLNLLHRPELSPVTYGSQSLALVLELGSLEGALRTRYETTARAFIELASLRYKDVPLSVVHADCHRGNLLAGRDGWFFLDFDDCALAPAVQDFWLLLPARVADCPDEVDAMVEGYQEFRSFPRETLGLIEILRGLRYLRYAGWIASRRHDPAFERAFPDFGSERYWQTQLSDLAEQLERAREGA